MAQRLSTSFINTVIPGAPVNVNVKSVPVGVATTGIVAIIGEAAGGAHFSEEDLKNNSFGPSQVDKIIAKYVSGPIVDAMLALAAPSNDTGIVGAANRVFVLKTNSGSKASAVVDTDYGTFEAANWGSYGNQLKYQVLESQAEATPSVESDAIAALSNSGPTAEEFDITCPAAAAITTGQYFTFQAGNNGIKYYGWFNKDGGGGDPAPAGRTGVEIVISTGDANTDVADAVQAAIDALSRKSVV